MENACQARDTAGMSNASRGGQKNVDGQEVSCIRVREQNHQRAEPSMDEVAVESHVGGSQGEAGADSDEVERAEDGPMCEAAAALAGSAAVEGVARDES